MSVKSCLADSFNPELKDHFQKSAMKRFTELVSWIATELVKKILPAEVKVRLPKFRYRTGA